MHIMKFENEEFFKELSKDGFNLFLGAGFSVMADNEFKESLPLGFKLKELLIDKFELSRYKDMPLPKVSQKLKRNKAGELFHFLKERYRVTNYDELYDNITKLTIKNIITTNIDDLIEKIFNKSNKSYSDVKISGSIEKPNMVNLFKLHGSVTYPFENEMLFSHEEMNVMFLKEPSLWHSVSLKLRSYPTIYWGTNLEDGNIVQLLSDQSADHFPSKPKWIVIQLGEKYDIYEEEFKEAGFNIIRSDTRQLLEHFEQFNVGKKCFESNSKHDKFLKAFPVNYVSENLVKYTRVRPIEDFFQGAPPVFNDIKSKNLVRLSYFEEAINTIYKYGNAIISGIPGCGKTTLLMQIALSEELKGYKFYFNDILEDEAKKLLDIVEKKDNVYVFIDNIYDNIGTFIQLLNSNKVKVIGAERELNYENIKHLINISLKQIIDISELSEPDIQNICKKMNRESHRFNVSIRESQKVSLFEIVYSLWKNADFKGKVKGLISDLNNYDKNHPNDNILEFFSLITYISYTGIPASMDMLWLYYSYENIEPYSSMYEKIMFKIKVLSSLIREVTEDEELYDFNQDYFTLRSKIFSELVISYIPTQGLKDVLNNFLERVNRSIIYRYDIFRKKAYDADITIRAFEIVEDGRTFYNNYIKNDPSPYIKHQYALYLWRKGEKKEAWEQIDKAYTDSAGKKYSINNTHAMILFENNIAVNPSDEEEEKKLKEVLDRTFDTLFRCLQKDNRKSYHITKYAEHTIEYINKYGIDEYSQKYLRNSSYYLENELNKVQFISKGVKNRFKQLKTNIKLAIEEHELVLSEVSVGLDKIL